MLVWNRSSLMPIVEVCISVDYSKLPVIKDLVAVGPTYWHLQTAVAQNLPKFLCLYGQSVLEGYNGTIMAYGQTGTGKTFTLGRLGEEDRSDRGIMVRAMEDILTNITPGEDTVTVSYLQVEPLCTLCAQRPRFWYLSRPNLLKFYPLGILKFY